MTQTIGDIQVLVRTHAQRSVTAQNTRERLLAVGLAKVLEQGWSATGIDIVLRECQVPKGSFYHYFASKEAFGYALLDLYHQDYMARIQRYWGQELAANSKSPADLRAAVMGWVEEMAAQMSEHGCKRGCLVGALGQELAGVHEGFRARLQACLNGYIDALSRAMERSLRAFNRDSKKSKTTGLLVIEPDMSTIDSEAEALCQTWAQAFWMQWQGAVLVAVLQSDASVLRQMAENWLQQWEAAAQAGDGAKPTSPANKTKPRTAAKVTVADNTPQTSLDF
jgi:AcrR family transcriptional regulator